MELWIKTQEKRLAQIVDFLEPREDREGKFYTLNGFNAIGSFIMLGKYNTEERALEVLKEINDIKFYKYMASLDFKSFVNAMEKYSEEEKTKILSKMNTYEMPKE